MSTSTIEAVWLASVDPFTMLHYVKCLGVTPSNRKLRLLACAFARQAWHLLVDEASRKAVEVAEDCADGKATAGELHSAHYAAIRAGAHMSWKDAQTPMEVAASDARCCPMPSAMSALEHSLLKPTATPGEVKAALFRCLLGNPEANCSWLIHRCPLCGQEQMWKLKPLDEYQGQWPHCPDCDVEMRHRKDSWLSWEGGRVRRLAQRIYDEHDWQAMPVLADMLEDAGCREDDLLAHCRGGGPHARGCHVVDILLGQT